MRNTFYFIKESIRISGIINFQTYSHSWGLPDIILLALVIAVWSISSRLTVMLREEAEISAYFDRDAGNTEELLNLIGQIDESVKYGW